MKELILKEVFLEMIYDKIQSKRFNQKISLDIDIT